MGLNPVWRKSLAFAALFTTWQDGANLTEIEATRQLFIEDMKILEGIAPESGAYFNEVRITRLFTNHLAQPFSVLLRSRRLRDMNSTGRNRSSGLTTISSEPSSRSTIRVRCSSFTKVLDRTSGTQTSSAESEAASSCRTYWDRLSKELGSRTRFLSVNVYDSCIVSGHSIN